MSATWCSATLPGVALAIATGARAEAGWFSFELRDGSILFPVSIEGVEGKALIDSGAGMFGVTEGFVRSAKLEPNGESRLFEGAFSLASARTFSRLPVRLLGVDADFRNVAVFPGTEHLLIVSVQFFYGHVIQIDYPNARMRLLPRSAVDLKRHANVRMAREAGSGRPVVRLALESKRKFWALLDTGNPGPLLVERRLANLERWRERLPAASYEMRDVHARSGNLDVVFVPSVALGPFELANVPVATPRENTRLLLREASAHPPTGSHIKRGVEADGILGYEILRHFVVTIDYELNRLHVAPPPTRDSKAVSADPRAAN